MPRHTLGLHMSNQSDHCLADDRTLLELYIKAIHHSLPYIVDQLGQSSVYNHKGYSKYRADPSVDQSHLWLGHRTSTLMTITRRTTKPLRQKHTHTRKRRLLPLG